MQVYTQHLHTMQNVQAKQFGIDARDILIELGKRQVVGGQEDMIIDVAAEFAKKKAVAAK